MRIFLLSVFTILSFSLLAQDPTPPVGLEGQPLRNWLRSNWYLPWHDDLGYSSARVAMYGTIDNQGGQIECVYTGFTQAAEPVSFPDPINTEHTVPQSLFNSQTPMRSDIHHLFPTHQNANSDRGSLPFDEVVDNQADEWIIGTSGNYNSSSNVPSSNIDAYSEVHHNVAFEPREDKKGDVARAVFYFFTMYTSFGDISQVGDIDQLYEWHQLDLPDAQEIERNNRTQQEQGNYNPYISQPNLVPLAWGITSSLTEYQLDFSLSLINGEIQINGLPDQVEIQLINAMGQVILKTQAAKRLDANYLPKGFYIVRVRDRDGRVGVRKLILD